MTERHVKESQRPDFLGTCELLNPVVAIPGIGSTNAAESNPDSSSFLSDLTESREARANLPTGSNVTAPILHPPPQGESSVLRRPTASWSPAQTCKFERPRAPEDSSTGRTTTQQRQPIMTFVEVVALDTGR